MADELDPITGEPVTPTEPSTDPTGKEEPKTEPQVPLSRLREEIEKRKELEKRVQPEPPKIEIPDEEKKIRETIEKIEKERAAQAKQEDKKLREELDTLHEIYGEFKDEKLLKLVEEYGVYDDEQNVKWEKAMELYEKLNIDPNYKPPTRLPSSKLSGDKPLEVEKPVEDFSKKSMGELVQEGLKKFGIK